MLAKKSQLLLRNFFLLKQTIEFIPAPDESTDIHNIIDSYPIDIDFLIQDSQKPVYQLFVKIEINLLDQKLPGYSVFAEGVGIFEFDKSIENDDVEKGNFLYYSGIPICINSLRSIISNVTSHGPLGKYSLPSIDVNELLKDKGVLSPKEKRNKKTKSR